MSTKQKNVEITLDGKTYAGTYKVFDNMVTVTYGVETKSNQVGNLDPEFVARDLLRALVRASGVAA